MNLFLSAAIALIAGLLFTRITSKFRLPDVTAYLVAGLLIGPFFLGRLGIPGLGFSATEHVENLNFISNTALGFIAFTIGNEFRLSQLKKTGRQALIVGLLESLVACLMVDLVLILLSPLFADILSKEGCLVLGAIASATAPAATLMVVRQYKAKGPVVDILLPVVALDDAVALAVFAVSFGVAQSISSGIVDVASVITTPLLEIVLSLALGALLGEILTQLEKLFHSGTNRMALIVGFVLLTVALSLLEFKLGSVTIQFSTLLVCMSLGTIFCNRCILSEDLMTKSDKWTSPLLALFFVLCGAELDLSVFSKPAVLLIGLLYILSRCCGKYLGAWAGCRITNAQPQVTKWLGVTLFPQAGVALGMCVTVSSWGEEGILIRNIILFSVLIYELIGPLMTKISLTKAGDIQPKNLEESGRSKALQTISAK